MHLLPYGLGLANVNLRAEEVRSTNCCAASAWRRRPTPKGGWVLGRGYDHGELDVGRHPTAEAGRGIARQPRADGRTCGHVGVANSMAMKLAGVGHNTPEPGRRRHRPQERQADRRVPERAKRLIMDVVPQPDQARMVGAIGAANDYLASLGFASATDMNVGMTAGLAEIAAYEAALEQGRLPLRMWQVLAGNPEGIAQEDLGRGHAPDAGRRFAALGRGEGLRRWVRRRAHRGLLRSYVEAMGGGTGVFTFPDEKIHALLKLYHEQGWQLDIHAIGDAAIEQVLVGMEAADSEAHPFIGRRHRIEHCGFVTRDQRRRMKARDIHPVPQATFMYEFGDLYVKVLGHERSDRAYPMKKTWLDEGAHPAASSDCPVCTVDPFIASSPWSPARPTRGRCWGPRRS